MIEFNDRFEVPAPAALVMKRFTDVESIAQCVPGVSIEGRDPDGSYLGTMTVAFGPRKIRFQGKVRCEFDLANRSGVLSGGGMAAGRGASVQARTEFHVRDASTAMSDAPMSVVEIASKTDLQGVLAQFALAGGTLLAGQLMRDFAASLTAQLTAQAGALPVAAQPSPLSATHLVLRSLQAWWSRWKKSFSNHQEIQ